MISITINTHIDCLNNSKSEFGVFSKQQQGALKVCCAVFSITNANGMVFNSYLKKNYDRTANAHWMPTTLQSHAVVANHLGVPPHTLHVFHIHLCATPHVVIVYQNPYDTAPHLLPCGKCMKLLRNHMNFLPHCKTYVPHHLEASHAWPPKKFQHHPTAPIFGPCIHHVKFVVALQPQFYFFHASLLALRWIPDRQVSFYVTPALLFWFIVVSSVFSTLFFS